MLARGSEWRRWDLHVHTPETAMNDQFGSWDEYLQEIEDHPDVKVIGVTDYLTITNYSKLKRYKEDGRLGNIDLLIPNIEFRLAPPSNRATAVNIHLLISPEELEHEEQINDALRRLTFEYNRATYSCTLSSLIRLGKAINNSIVDDKVALEKGAGKFKVDFTKFKEWYRSELWLNRNSLVAVAAGDDGLSGFSYDGGWSAHREEITRFSHIIFSGQPKEREYWLGKSKPEYKEHIDRLGGLKPCVHGSDAHSIERLFNPDMDRYCWIKADTTFEGLRQILYEPENRVYIGPTPPIYHDDARIIRSVKISNADEWLDDVEIPLNSDLVSIIGQKGSGKSALAELIAYAAGSWKANEPSSFLRRAEDYLSGTQIDIKWAGGTADSVVLLNDTTEEEKVRYLSQNFVERLCAEDALGLDLVKEIESVIFSHLDPSDTMNASSFDELRSIKTNGIQSEGQRLKNEVYRLMQEEFNLRINASRLDEKKTRIKTLATEHNGLQKQLLITNSEEEALVDRELQEKYRVLHQKQQEIAQCQKILQKISDLRTHIRGFNAQISKFYSELHSQLSEVGLSDVDIENFKPVFSGDVEGPLASRENYLKNTIDNILGSATNPSQETVYKLKMDIQNLENQKTADKARQKKIRITQTRIVEIDTEIERIQAEIDHIEGPEKERIDAARDEFRTAYSEYFKNLKREQDALEHLYTPVTENLQGENALSHEKLLEFSIRWIADVNKWMKKGADLFDQRKNVPYGSIDAMTKAARDILGPAWTSGDFTRVIPALDKFLQEFKKDEYKRPGNYLRSGVTHMDLFQWLYGVDHISLSYGLKYNGTELENLSPGTKGIVLLILYLGIDQSDTRPLIVDQPDENLDNESIFDLLMGYFRTAKQRRQVILISHNPNLVVNSDSEQIIVAHAERRNQGLPHMQYVSGALEDTGSNGDGIRQRVCRILEGGEIAFLHREKRYALGK